jgi:hypothetical protein
MTDNAPEQIAAEHEPDPITRLECAVLGVSVNGQREGGVLKRVARIETRLDQLLLAILTANLAGAVAGGVLANLLH